MTKKDRLIVYVADRGFVIPTMHSVAQMFSSEIVSGLSDAIVFLLDVTDEEVAHLERDFKDVPVSFVIMDQNGMGIADGATFHKTHVPVSTLARFLTAQLIPSNYEHIIYVDGDTFVSGDMAPLIRHNVGEGKIAAGCDAMWLYDGDSGPYWNWAKKYLNGIGIEDSKDYFNAGVMLFRRKTWIDIAPKAMQYFLSNSEKCHYHDQSALNAVSIGNREVLSPWWNFLSNYANLGVQDSQKLRLIHFTGGAKPWFFDGPPWSGQFLASYSAIARARPSLAPFVRPASAESIAALKRAERKQRLKAMFLTPWRRPLRRRRFAAYCRDTTFDV